MEITFHLLEQLEQLEVIHNDSTLHLSIGKHGETVLESIWDGIWEDSWNLFGCAFQWEHGLEWGAPDALQEVVTQQSLPCNRNSTPCEKYWHFYTTPQVFTTLGEEQCTLDNINRA